MPRRGKLTAHSYRSLVPPALVCPHRLAFRLLLQPTLSKPIRQASASRTASNPSRPTYLFALRHHVPRLVPPTSHLSSRPRCLSPLSSSLPIRLPLPQHGHPSLRLSTDLHPSRQLAACLFVPTIDYPDADSACTCLSASTDHITALANRPDAYRQALSSPSRPWPYRPWPQRYDVPTPVHLPCRADNPCFALVSSSRTANPIPIPSTA